MLFPIISRRARPEPLAAAPRLRWVRPFAYQVNGDRSALRVNLAGHFRVLLPSAYAANAAGTAFARNTTGALRVRRF